MATKRQGSGKNTNSNVLQLVSQLAATVALPEGVVLRDAKDMEIWSQFTRARPLDAWRDLDLVILAKAVKLEADIRKYQEKLDSTAVLMRDPTGKMIINPLMNIIERLQAQQYSAFRAIGVCQQDQDARSLNSQGKEQERLRKTINGRADDLIAR